MSSSFIQCPAASAKSDPVGLWRRNRSAISQPVCDLRLAAAKKLVRFLSLANSLLGSLTGRAIRNSRFHCPVAPCLAPRATLMTTAALAAFTATVALAASRAWGAASGFLAKNEFAQHVDKTGGDDEADDELLCHPKILDAI